MQASHAQTSEAISRRGFMAAAGALALSRMVRGQPTTTTAPAGHRYRIAACDWMMLKRQTLGAITRARECGCDGVETDMGPLSKNPTFDNKFLSEPGFAEAYLKSCRENNIQISSLAMSGFYAQSFPEREIDKPLQDCIKTMKLLGVKVAFLPLGVYGDLVKRPEVRPVVVERLKRVGGWAAEAGVTIGVETALDAAGETRLLEDIGSPGIRIYYNFQNPLAAGRDLCAELKALGKDRICQIHPTNSDVHWLQDDPAIDMPKVKKTLDEMGWSGWLVIERSRRADRGRDVIGNFSANAKYLKSVFQSEG